MRACIWCGKEIEPPYAECEDCYRAGYSNMSPAELKKAGKDDDE